MDLNPARIIGLTLICVGSIGFAVSGGSVWLLLASIPTVMLGVALSPPAPGAEKISADKFLWVYCGAWAYAGRVWLAPMVPGWPPWAMFATCWALWMIAAYTLVPAAHAFYSGTWPFLAIPDTEPVIPAYVPIQGRTMVLSHADLAAFRASLSARC